MRIKKNKKKYCKNKKIIIKKNQNRKIRKKYSLNKKIKIK